MKLKRVKRSRHNFKSHKLYGIWHNMKQRCYNPNVPSYKIYGQRGIRVCKKWMNFIPFYEWAILLWEEGLELDRIENNGNYTPKNCRFVTDLQNSNNRNCNWHLKNKYVPKPLKELSSTTGINYHTIITRLHRGWKVEDAISIKSRTYQKT